MLQHEVAKVVIRDLRAVAAKERLARGAGTPRARGLLSGLIRRRRSFDPVPNRLSRGLDR